MIHAYLNKFKNNCVFRRTGERFECRFQGQCNDNMMRDYIWGLRRESAHTSIEKTKVIGYNLRFFVLLRKLKLKKYTQIYFVCFPKYQNCIRNINADLCHCKENSECDKI